MASRSGAPYLQTDTAATSGQVSVATSSTPILGNNPSRIEVTIVNTSANIVDLAFATADDTTSAGLPLPPTAVAANGIRLNANGGSWTSNAYTGPIAGIAQTGASIVTVAEF